MSIVIGGQTGEVIQDGKIVSRQYVVGCDLHRTPVEMKRGSVEEKNGEITWHYSCPTCKQTVTEYEINREVERHKQSKLHQSTLDK